MTALQKRLRDGSLLFFLLPVGYFLLYGFHGFADTDQGFVPALSWRVVNGQVPYIDFCYVRPPLTPYLHALEFLIWPDSWEMLAMRLDFYLMMWASVFWGVQTLNRLLDRANAPLLQGSQWWLAVLAFIFAVHNFPALAWHTVDGVFFASLGAWLLTHPQGGWRAVAGLCGLAVAGLAKQPFAILLPLGAWTLFVLLPRRAAALALLAAAAILAVLSIGALAVLPRGFGAAMLSQTGGASSPAELLKAGVTDYLWPGGVLFGLGIAGLWTMKRLWGGPDGPRWWHWLLLLGVLLYPFGMAAIVFWRGEFMSPRLGIYQALQLCALLQIILFWRGGHRVAAANLLLLAAISWASSLSWGYAVPALFALPGIFSLLQLLGVQLPDGSSGAKNVLLRWAWMVPFLGFGLMQLLPYRDGPRWELQAGAGEIFPKLSGIYTSPTNLARLQELKSLAETYPAAPVLPAMPAADYLLGRMPSIAIDWEHDAEVGPHRLAAVMADMNASCAAVLVESERREEAHSKNLNYRSSLLAEVLDHWQPGPTGRFYQVYFAPTTMPTEALR